MYLVVLLSDCLHGVDNLEGWSGQDSIARLLFVALTFPGTVYIDL